MKAIVRDDIISLDSFVAAEFKYKYYLELLMKAGNYCFLDQFKTLIKSGQTIIKGMEENNLVATENLNKNYKYVYLTDTAMKYLYLRDDEKDYSDVTKNRISVKKVNKNPTEKQLLSSAYKFHLLAVGEDLISKDSLIESFINIIFGRYYKEYNIEKTNRDNEIRALFKEIQDIEREKSKFESYISKFNKKAGTFNSVKENEEYTQLNSKCKSIKKDIHEISQTTFKKGKKELELQLEKYELLRDEANRRLSIKENSINILKEIVNEFKLEISDKQQKLDNLLKEEEKESNLAAYTILPKVDEVMKVFKSLYDISKIIIRIKDNNLEFIILDTGNFKTAYGYIKQINKIKELNLEFKEIKIIIYSYAEHRAQNLYNEFIKARNEKIRAQKTMHDFNSKTNNASKKPDFYIAARKIFDNTPDFEIEIKDDFFYMKKYMEFISGSTKSIKRKDKKAIDDLAERLKNNG